MKKVMIIGATSAIAHEAARHFANDGADLFLVGRSPAKLTAVANDLKVHGAGTVETFALDLTELSSHQAMFEQAIASLDWLDMLLIAHGTLGDQRKAELSVEETLHEFSTNATSVIALLTLAGNYFEQRHSGLIAIISSVAGDRGRKRNYVYGAAKSAVSTFAQGLRGRLVSSGVTVVTIKPGFVDTPMTAGLKKGLLFASASGVGLGVYRAMMRKQEVVYLPWFWRPIMLIVRSIPERIFKNMSF